MSARGTILLNRSSGSSQTDTPDLIEVFPEADVQGLDPEATEGQVAGLLSGRPAWIGVAGGDGTIRSVAQVLAGGEIPLLPIPTGTHNHFARALGIDDLEAAHAATTVPPRRIDLGQVNSRYFLNNSSIGAYPWMVETREQHQRLLPKWAAQVTAGLTQLRRATKVGVVLDGDVYEVWMVFVGNNCYGDRLSDMAERPSLSQGVLDIRVFLAERRWARLRFAADIATGHLARSSTLRRLRVAEVSLEVRRPTVEVSLDGEATTLSPSLHYRSCPGSLLVHAAPGAPAL